MGMALKMAILKSVLLTLMDHKNERLIIKKSISIMREFVMIFKNALKRTEIR
jgi:hypothetical protein